MIDTSVLNPQQREAVSHGHGPLLETELKLGVLCGSLVAGILGTLILLRAERRGPRRRRHQHLASRF